MTLIRPESALTSESANELGMDVGICRYNAAIDELLTGDPATAVDRMENEEWTDPDGNTQQAVLLGITRGGVEYNPGVTQRQVEFDSRRTNIKGFWRVDMIEPSIKTTLLQVANAELFHKYLGAAESSTVGYYTRIKQTLVVNDELDYWWNMVVAQVISGYTLPQLFIIQNPHVSTQEPYSMTDKNESVLSVTFTSNTTYEDPFGEDGWSPGECWIPSRAS